MPATQAVAKTNIYDGTLAEGERLAREIVQANLGQAHCRVAGRAAVTMAPLTPMQRGMLTAFLSLGVFMNVLDLSIANVAIPTIAGELGVSADTGTWVITSFAVCAAIAMPLTGWLGTALR